MRGRRFWLLACFVSMGMAAGAARPVARVLEVSGPVVIRDARQQSRPAEVFGSIYGGEQIVVPADGMVVLGFRNDGHLERVKQPGKLTAGERGCEPQALVESVAVAERHRSLVQQGIRELPAVTQGAAAVMHTGYSKHTGTSPAPIPGSVLVTTAPKFAWPEVPHAEGYEVTIRSGDAPIRFTRTKEAKADFALAAPLQRGKSYQWLVLAEVEGKKVKAFEGTFAIASEAQQQQLAEWLDLATASEPAIVALAAKNLERAGFLAEARDLHRRLEEKKTVGPKAAPRRSRPE